MSSRLKTIKRQVLWMFGGVLLLAHGNYSLAANFPCAVGDLCQVTSQQTIYDKEKGKFKKIGKTSSNYQFTILAVEGTWVKVSGSIGPCSQKKPCYIERNAWILLQKKNERVKSTTQKQVNLMQQNLLTPDMCREIAKKLVHKPETTEPVENASKEPAVQATNIYIQKVDGFAVQQLLAAKPFCKSCLMIEVRKQAYRQKDAMCENFLEKCIRECSVVNLWDGFQPGMSGNKSEKQLPPDIAKGRRRIVEQLAIGAIKGSNKMQEFSKHLGRAGINLPRFIACVANPNFNAKGWHGEDPALDPAQPYGNFCSSVDSYYGYTQITEGTFCDTLGGKANGENRSCQPCGDIKIRELASSSNCDLHNSHRFRAELYNKSPYSDMTIKQLQNLRSLDPELQVRATIGLIYNAGIHKFNRDGSVKSFLTPKNIFCESNPIFPSVCKHWNEVIKCQNSQSNF